MKHSHWLVIMGVLLVLLSASLYVLHYSMFKDAHHIFIFMLGDIAFLPIYVLLVTIIIHGRLRAMERRTHMEKLNMVIEVFFSEVGTKLLTHFSGSDPDLDKIRDDLRPSGDWSDQDFSNVSQRLRQYRFEVHDEKTNLESLRTLLVGKRGFLVGLLENPNLFEHESFTELLRAIFHLTEELDSRESLGDRPESDRQHIEGDMSRAYTPLVSQWLDYMKYLKANYPYLFSLAMRTNPFDRDASPVVT